VQLERSSARNCHKGVSDPGAGIVQESLDFLSVAASNPYTPLPSVDLLSSDATKWHEMLVFLYTYRLPSANNPE
jgi:hypothetical protein